MYEAIIANNYGDCLTDAGQLDKAEALLRTSHEQLVTFGDATRIAKSKARLQRLEAARRADRCCSASDFFATMTSRRACSS